MHKVHVEGQLSAGINSSAEGRGRVHLLDEIYLLEGDVFPQLISYRLATFRGQRAELRLHGAVDRGVVRLFGRLRRLRSPFDPEPVDVPIASAALPGVPMRLIYRAGHPAGEQAECLLYVHHEGPPLASDRQPRTLELSGTVTVVDQDFSDNEIGRLDLADRIVLTPDSPTGNSMRKITVDGEVEAAVGTQATLHDSGAIEIHTSLMLREGNTTSRRTVAFNHVNDVILAGDIVEHPIHLLNQEDQTDRADGALRVANTAHQRALRRRRVEVDAFAHIIDSDFFGADEEGFVERHTGLDLRGGSWERVVRFTEVVDEEVRVEVEIDAQLRPGGSIAVAGNVLLFEGEDRRTTDLDGAGSFLMTCEMNEAVSRVVEVRNDDEDADDRVILRVHVRNVAAPR